MEKSVIDLKVGQKAKIIGFKSKEIETKFLSVGLIPDAIIELRRKAPFGGSYYLVMEFHSMALRKSEASQLIVEVYE